MFVYVDQNCHQRLDYSSSEEKNKIMDDFHEIAKKEMRVNDYTEFRYAIIDFHKDQSVVFIMNRKTTETFEITGC